MFSPIYKVANVRLQRTTKQINELSASVESSKSTHHRIFVYNFCHVANWSKSRIGRSLSGHKRQQKLKQINFRIPSQFNFSTCCCFFFLSVSIHSFRWSSRRVIFTYISLPLAQCVCVSVIAHRCTKCKWFELSSAHKRIHMIETEQKKGPYTHAANEKTERQRERERERASEFFINMIAIVHTLS